MPLPIIYRFPPPKCPPKIFRMAMETVLVFARETGRTLVIPPAQRFYLLKRPAVSFADMFPVENLEDYMDVMTMEVCHICGFGGESRGDGRSSWS